MRGPRFRRPRVKKLSAREKKEKRGTPIYYQEPEHIEPLELSSKTLNALEHLGNQRFALPPFTEHFQRWIKDVKTVLREFEAHLPEAIDQEYGRSVENSLSEAQDVLTGLTEIEKSSSSEVAAVQQELSTSERELSNLDQEYKKKVRETRRLYEQSVEKLRAEIDSLDKQRLRMLRKKTGFLQRIFGRSDSGLEERTSNALLEKKTALDRGKDTLRQELEKGRVDYENQRERLVRDNEALRTKYTNLRGNSLDDALEARRQTCRDLHRIVTEAVDRMTRAQSSEKNQDAQ